MMNKLDRSFYKIVSLLVLLIAGSFSHATLLTAKGTASKNTLVASANNIITVKWQLGASANHNAGSTSSGAALINPAIPVTLGAIGGVLAKTGGGPFAFSETLTFTAVQVKAWQQAGVQRLVLQRNFIGGNAVIAEVSFRLSSSGLTATRNGASVLSVQRLRIALDNKQTAVKVIPADTVLQPILTVNYAGTGLLEGKWQIAEPGSTEGKPLYRTLSIVRQPLVRAQESQVKGPVLPSSRTGKYLLRFCVTNRELVNLAAPTGDTACPIAGLTVNTAYQVMASKIPVDELNLKSPQPQSSVDNETPFAWQTIAGAALYKLDVFQAQGDQEWFVTGMLLPDNQTQTVLSELMQEKLNDGGVYRWRVSALDEEGKLLAQSDLAGFQYKP